MYSAAQTTFLAVTIAHSNGVFNCVYQPREFWNVAIGLASFVQSVSKSVRIIVQAQRPGVNRQRWPFDAKRRALCASRKGVKNLDNSGCALVNAGGYFQDILGLAFLAGHW